MTDNLFISRPAYRPLEPHMGPALIVVQGAGALEDLRARASEFVARAEIIVLPEGAGFGGVARDLRARILAAPMGLRLSLAGSEGFLGAAIALALGAGLRLDAIQAEHCGPPTRRMACVHCKGITEEVATDPFACAQCGRMLFVRDHFSRRLGAYQGVCVDAETPGVIPPIEEIRA